MHTSDIVNFYSGGKDNKGRTYDEIMSWSDEGLEYVHDYIQWIFPLKEKSAFNKDAPLLDDDSINEFKTKGLKDKLLLSCERYLSFLRNNKDIWLVSIDHNHLRITRMLKCLVLFDLKSEAQFYYNEIMLMANGIVSESSVDFWKRASE